MKEVVIVTTIIIIIIKSVIFFANLKEVKLKSPIELSSTGFYSITTITVVITTDVAHSSFITTINVARFSSSFFYSSEENSNYFKEFN